MDRKPSIGRIRHMFTCVNLKSAYTIGSFDDSHIMIKLNCMEEYQNLLVKDGLLVKQSSLELPVDSDV